MSGRGRGVLPPGGPPRPVFKAPGPGPAAAPRGRATTVREPALPKMMPKTMPASPFGGGPVAEVVVAPVEPPKEEESKEKS